MVPYSGFYSTLHRFAVNSPGWSSHSLSSSILFFSVRTISRFSWIEASLTTASVSSRVTFSRAAINFQIKARRPSQPSSLALPVADLSLLESSVARVFPLDDIPLPPSEYTVECTAVGSRDESHPVRGLAVGTAITSMTAKQITFRKEKKTTAVRFQNSHLTRREYQKSPTFLACPGQKNCYSREIHEMQVHRLFDHGISCDIDCDWTLTQRATSACRELTSHRSQYPMILQVLAAHEFLGCKEDFGQGRTFPGCRQNVRTSARAPLALNWP